ncbi:hypothetical protein [Elizabethkingia argenteiflava]|uniref:hypothetical protein n=1 Tax=Elizabethkingia argenteiflava TaxID=2681556 RepID=UPI001FCE3155|nr:hypothetical protein [Elizabethkingia argenteiflava]
MKKNTNIGLMLVLTVSMLMVSCKRDQESFFPTMSTLESTSPSLRANYRSLCHYNEGYVDQSWSPLAVLKSELSTSQDTEFMKQELKKNAELWDLEVPILGFIEDTAKPSSTYNAASYSDGKIYYGYAIYEAAKSKSPDNIVNAMILAHEYGHQLQFKYDLRR